MSLNAFTTQYGRNDTVNGRVDTTRFKNELLNVLGTDKAVPFLQLAASYAETDPMGSIYLMEMAGAFIRNDKIQLTNEEFRAAVTVGTSAVKAFRGTKKNIAGDYMRILSDFAGADNRNLQLANSMYLMVHEDHSPLGVLLTQAQKYGDRLPNLLDFAVTEARRLKDVPMASRAVGMVLTQLTDPTSDDFSRGVNEVAKPISSGESTNNVLLAQFTALSRSQNNGQVNQLAQSIDGFINRRFETDVQASFFLHAMVLTDARGDKVGEAAAAYLSERFIECYFSSNDERKKDMKKTFEREEATDAYKGKDFGATLLGQTETRINMIESGVDKDSALRRRLEAKKLVKPAVR